MKESFQEILSTIKNKNIRLLIPLSEKSQQTLFLKDIDCFASFFISWNHDKLVVLQTDDQYILYKIVQCKPSSKEVTCEKLFPVTKIRSFFAENLEFCEFELLLPVVVLKDTFLVPYDNTSLIIGRNFSIAAINEAMHKDNLVVVTKQLEGTQEISGAEDLHLVGTVCSMNEINKIDNKNFKINFAGLYRIHLGETILKEDVFMTQCLIFYEQYNHFSFPAYQKAFFVKLNTLKQKTNTLEIPSDLIESLIESQDSLFFCFCVVCAMIFNPEKRRDIMRTELQNIFEIILSDLQEKIFYLDLEENIDSQVKKKINDQNKRFFIREKIEALKKEINEDDPFQNDNMSGKSKEDPKLYPAHVKQCIVEEYEKLRKNPHSSDAYIIQQHLTWIFSLPWYTKKERNNDLNAIYEYMDQRHVGSERLKRKLIESLNIRNPKDSGKNLILVGPPGIGKSSIAEIFAQSIGLPWYTIFMGGISDSSYLVGHGRTYVGALPGAIVCSLKYSGCLNGVVILDEIDKMNHNSGKDPLPVLTRALDRSQNKTFKDNYIEPTIDVSEILYIATANSLDRIHPAFLDRCDIVELSGYCVEEKTQIGQTIFEKLKTRLLIEPGEISISNESVQHVVENYTRESGTRKLAQILETIVKKVLIELEQKKEVAPVLLVPQQIDNYLELSEYDPLSVDSLEPGVGMVRGLAYTSSGGVSLFIQCAKIQRNKNSKDSLKITGNLAKVMQESCEVAVAFIKSQSKALGIDEAFFETYDIHIHAPEGAIPKDGPSAGVTVCTALISLIKNLPVKQNIAMTGEIEINGQVLPIGGLIEKLNAADRESRVTGMSMTVFVPKDNMKYIARKIHPTVLKNLDIRPVNYVQEILQEAF